MKELSIEEKAKAYDEALDICRKLYNKARADGYTSDMKDYEQIFPELKESDDERIRKGIIKSIMDLNNDWLELHGVTKETALAWLEKQGEHANFRNKIQIGDKVTRNRDGVLVNLSQLNRVAKKDEKQGEQKPIIPKFRVGDIITNGLCTIQISSMDDKYYWHDNNIVGGDIESIDKEYKLVEQKPAWSEEDATHYNRILKELNLQKEMPINASVIEEVTSDIIWFKSLKDRVQPQPKQEWGEEDKYILGEIITHLEEYIKLDEERYSGEDVEYYQRDINWLKSLKGRVLPKQEWKPSDEQMDALHYVTNFDYGGHKATLVSLYEQLKKLKG